MEVFALDAALSALVRGALTPRTFQVADSSPKPVAALRMQVVELVRRRDIVQDMATAPGANVAKAKKEISALGESIQAAETALAAALAADITGAAVDAALAVMVSRDQDEEGNGSTVAWDEYWASLDVEDRRALIPGAGIRPLLWPTNYPRRLTNAG